MDHPIRLAARELDGVLKSVADVNPAFMTTPDKAAALVELSAIEARVAELRLRVTADASDVAEESGARDVGVWSAAATHADVVTAEPTCVWRWRWPTVRCSRWR